MNSTALVEWDGVESTRLLKQLVSIQPCPGFDLRVTLINTT